jgi:hypothetical protein
MSNHDGRPPRNVIPLPLVRRGDGAPQPGETMRAAVIQVITDLVVRRVPPAERLPQYQAATDLLEEAGYSLTELLEAAEPGPAQESLFEELGI